MKTSRVKPRAPTSATAAAHRVGCVSFLNAKPLINGLETQTDLSIQLDVPSRLLGQLETAEVDMALCPVIDYQRSACALEVVPVGGICCRGPTLTVRLFSRVPPQQITHVHADVDSHTSVVLLKVVLSQQYGLTPQVVPYDAQRTTAAAALGGPSNAPVSLACSPPPQAILLIGDKVVTDPPPAHLYPHGLDLGHAWFELTGLPFVFAVWMTRAGADLGDLPATLANQRVTNADNLIAIADRHAPGHGWPAPLARRYLTELIHYEIGAEQLQAIKRFHGLAYEQGLIDHLKPLRTYATR